MDIPTKSREYLTGRFKKNAIPTETDFRDLIEAPLNQKDDGVAKRPGEPLSVEAVATGSRPVLRLYESFSDATPQWSLALQDGAGARKLTVADGAGRVRLSIDQGTGEIKVGELRATDVQTTTLTVNTLLTVKTLDVGGSITAGGGLTVPAGKATSVDTLSAAGLITAGGGVTVPVGKAMSVDTLSAKGLITAGGGVTVPVGKATSVDTLSATGMITASGGVTVPKGKVFTTDKLTVTGLFSAVGGLDVPAGQPMTADTITAGVVRVSKGITFDGRVQSSDGMVEIDIRPHATAQGVRYAVMHVKGLVLTNHVRASGKVTCSELVVTSAAKQFRIDHPLEPRKRSLVHACIEGPEAAVYYRGEGQLTGGRAVLTLPAYFESLARKEGRTVTITPRCDGEEPVSALAASGIEDGQCTVRSIDDRNPAQRFYWEVKAVRADLPLLETEPAKKRPSATAAPAAAPLDVEME